MNEREILELKLKRQIAQDKREGIILLCVCFAAIGVIELIFFVKLTMSLYL